MNILRHFLLIITCVLNCAIHAQGITNEFGYPVMPTVSSSSTDPVGSLSTNFSLSPTGGAVCGMPIRVASGVHGLQPDLSILYNSQTGNSLVGYGCMLTGISAITRGCRNIYHDGKAYGIDYSSDDAFCLDGQRLVFLRSLSNGDTIKYCLEHAPYTVVWLIGANLSPSAMRFKVWTPDGLIHNYATQLTNNGTGTNSGKVYAWYKTSCTDAVGNTMYYEYAYRDGYPYLYHINYGGSRVDFEYESRSDTIVLPMAWTNVKVGRRLKSISAYTATSGGIPALLRKYTLIYHNNDSTQSGYSRLYSVTESNSNNESLRPVIFTWNYPSAYHCDKSTSYISQNLYASGATRESMSLMAADLNGDGMTDIAELGRANEFGTSYYFIRTYHANQSQTGAVSFTQRHFINLGNDANINNLWNSQKAPPLAMDMDGDGTNELLVPMKFSSETVNECGFYVFKGGDYVGGVKYSDLHVNEFEKILWAGGDFDNDGTAEVAIIEKYKSGSWYHGAIMGGFTESTAYCKPFRFYLTYEPKYLRIADMNNDGMSDIIVFYDGGYWVFFNDGTWLDNRESTNPKYPVGTAHNTGRTPAYVWQGDFNGDGMSDFLLAAPDDTRLFFETGNGDGTLAESVAANLNVCEQSGTDKDDHDFSCIVADLDGDGRSDVVLSKAHFASNNLGYYSFFKTYTYWLFSDGRHLSVKSQSSSLREDDAFPQYYIAGDFNGNGIMEVGCLTYDCYNNINANEDPVFRIYRNSAYHCARGKVTTFTDGMGNATDIAYKPLTDNSVYTRESNNNYIPGNTQGLPFPVVTVNAPLHVVSSVTTTNGASGNMTEDYQYESLKMHMQGRGLLGMTAITVNNQTTGLTVENRVQEWRQDVFLPQILRETRTIGTQTAVKTTTIEGNTDIQTKAFDISSETIEAYDYDNTYSRDYYKYTEGELWVYTHQANSVEKTITRTNFQLTGGLYLPRLIVESQSHADAAGSVLKQTTLTYDDKGEITCKTELANTGQPVTTVYAYDAYGNMISSQTTATGAETINRQYQYDATHRYVTHSLERDYIETEYVYDQAGNVLSETDKTRSDYPQSTTYEYDGWGRMTAMTLPAGLRTTYTTGWGNTNEKCYFTLKQGTAIPWTVTWYDRRGRITEEETIGAGNLSVKKKLSYASNGLLSSRLMLNRDVDGDSVCLQESFSYDGQGRIVSYVNDGTTTNYSYGYLQSTTTKNGQTKHITYDGAGNKRTVTDPSGTITYKYGNHWKPVLVTSHGDTITMEYDQRGYQVRLSAPDAGIMTYTYDAYGRLSTQQDARGLQTTYTYDSKGRLTVINAAGETTVNEYGNNSSNQGLLLSSTRGGNGVEYEYDQYGRVTGEYRHTVSLSGLNFYYSYGTNGLLSSTTYPQSLTVTHHYDAYGNKTDSYVGDQMVWQMQSVKAVQTIEKLGSNLAIRHLYDQRGRTTRQSIENTQEEEELYRLSYTYDNATDNLLSREGMLYHREDFTYDALDRLTDVHSNGTAIHGTCYADNGNITYQTDIGNYVYESSSKPHAVTGVENSTFLIPQTPLNVSYNAYGKANVIEDEETGWRVELSYGPDNERWQTRTYMGDSLVTITRYMGDYEEVKKLGRFRRFYYIGNDVLYIKENGKPDQLCFLFKDHLGSIVRMVDEAGDEKFAATYDAWGRQDVYRNEIGFFRGFTGHEMLPQFGLINMNGRLYDPLIARFLSPDSYVQEPFNTQSFNRYTYCLNNPLKYVDPDGEIAWWVVAAVIGGALNVATNYAQINNAGQFFAYFGVGAVSGALGGAAATYAAGLIGMSGVVGGAVAGLANGVVSGSTLGLANTLLQGGSLSDAFGAAWTGAYKGAFIGTIVGGVYGGISAYKNGASILTGKTKTVSVPDVEETALTTAEDVSVTPAEPVKQIAPEDVANRTVQSEHFPQGEGDYSVYVGNNREGDVLYGGITKRNPEVRWGEHVNSKSPRAYLNYRIVNNARGLSKIQARIIEQNIINEYGLENLYNKINSISPRYWEGFGIRISF